MSLSLKATTATALQPALQTLSLWVLFPALAGYYSLWFYTPYLKLLANSLMVFFPLLLLWGILYLALRKTISTNSWFLAITLTGYLLLWSQQEQIPPFSQYLFYGGALLTVTLPFWSISLKEKILSFFQVFGLLNFAFSHVAWPLYREIKLSSFTLPSLSTPPARTPPERDIYVFLLDEHPSPAVAKYVFPQCDTFLFALQKRGFYVLDSIKTHGGTLHTLREIYNSRTSLKEDAFGVIALQNLQTLFLAQEQSYQLHGILPYYPPLQRMPFQWEGYFLPDQAFTELLAPKSRFIASLFKHRYDLSFLEKIQNICAHPPTDERKHFFHFHVFVTHALFATGASRQWLNRQKQPLYTRIRQALALTAQEVLTAVDTLRQAYRRIGKPEPVIVIFSDHGLHLGEPERLGLPEIAPHLVEPLHYQAFFAAYIPHGSPAEIHNALSPCHDFPCLSGFLEKLLSTRKQHSSQR
ncbi:MAG: hypothetical protein KatS3mg025_0025 [Bacteroidia bacterium]|nr:MAG: hypothetical protein KatS3mg025_0025 [Bacteroidia bacterium]